MPLSAHTATRPCTPAWRCENSAAAFEKWNPWRARWQERSAREARSGDERRIAMHATNPAVIPRNHRVEEALAAASDTGDLAPFEQLLNALRRPFDEDPALARFAEPAPGEFMAEFRTFCGT